MYQQKETKMKTISKERAEKIARNINAMDTNYHRSDDRRSWKFWNNLEKVIKRKLSELTNDDIEAIRPLLNPTEAKFFNLI